MDVFREHMAAGLLCLMLMCHGITYTQQNRGILFTIFALYWLDTYENKWVTVYFSFVLIFLQHINALALSAETKHFNHILIWRYAVRTLSHAEWEVSYKTLGSILPRGVSPTNCLPRRKLTGYHFIYSYLLESWKASIWNLVCAVFKCCFRGVFVRASEPWIGWVFVMTTNYPLQKERT